MMLILSITLQAQTNISNYTFSTTTSATYTPITGGTVAFSGAYDNSVSAAITMGGTFPFGGASITTCYISSNGFITFGAAPSVSSYTPMSTLGTTTGAIAAFAQDAGGSGVAGAAPEIRYQNLGTEFVVQYTDHANYFNSSTERLNFQIRLTYATGAINIVYGTCTNPGTSTSGSAPQVGIRGNSVTWTTNVNSLLVGNVPAATTCDWSNAVSGNANTSAMLFTSTTNANVKIPAGLAYTWIPPVAATLAPVRTFAAVSGITSTDATLGWTAATAATAYNVRYRIPGSCTWTSFSGNPVAATTATLSGLISNTIYQIQVQASDGTNSTIWSNIPTSAAGSGLNGYTSTGTFTTLANPCTGTPTAGTVAPASQNVCSGTTPAALVLTGFSSGVSNITFQWEQASDAAFTISVTNAVGGAGATTSSYTPPSFAGTNIYYRCKVTCTPSTLSATSTVASVLTAAAPATQASAITVVPNTTTATISWTNGNGGRRFVVVNTTNSFTDPASSADVTGITTVYTSGEVKMYDGTGSSVSITGLVSGQTYYVRIYEYLRCTGAPNVNYYNISTATNNPNSFTTLTPPINDIICGALNLVVDDPTPICTNTTVATVSASDPDNSAGCSASNNTVWYKFTPTVSGLHNIIGSVPALSLDGQATWLHLYTATGSCPGTLTLTAAGGITCAAAPSSATPGTSTTVSTTSLTAGTIYYIYVDGQSGDFGDMCLRILGPTPMTYISSTTTQPNTTVIAAGSVNQDIIRLEITVNGSINPLSVSQIDFNTNGTTLPANITNAKVFYTGTSTTFSTTTAFGTAIANPNGNFSATGSQILTGALTNTVNYFWLAYDVACGATAGNVVDASATGFVLGGTPQTPTVTAPAGTRTIVVLYAPTRTDGNSTTSIQAGSVNNQMVYSLISGSSSCPANATQVDFTVSGTAPATDIIAARCYYTNTSTFSTTNLYGSAITNPIAGTISFSGSQLLANGANYFWLVYDISCNATATNTVNGDINSITVGGNVIAVTGTATAANAITALYAPTRTDGNSTTAIPLGTANATMVYGTISGSASCSSPVTQVNFTVSGTNTTADIARAKCYYTTSTTFNVSTPFGSAIVNPAVGAISFNGSQALAAGSNYFWLVYDISCSGTAANTVNGDITSIVVGATPYTPTGTTPSANALSAATTNFSTISNGDFSDPTIWACGAVPPSNTTSVIINNNITVNSTGIAGDVTISAGAKLTISGGTLTLGASSTGAATGNSNKLLTVNGTLEVSSGTLNINGGLRFTTAGYTFNMLGGTINIDGNDGTSPGSITSNGSLYVSAIGTHNVVGGNINILDPAYSATPTNAYAIGYSTPSAANNDAAWSTGCTVTFGGGDDVNTANLYGYNIDCNISQGTLNIGTLVVADGNYASKRHMNTASSTGNIASVKNLTVNAGAEVVQTSSDAVLVITGNLVNNGTMTMAINTADRGLVFAGDVQYSGGIIFSPGTTAQSLSGTGFFKKSTADGAVTAQTGNYLNSLSFFHLKTSPGVTLQMPVTTSALGLRGGKVSTTAINFLALGSGTTLTGNPATLTASTGTITGAGGTSHSTSALFSGGFVSGPFNRWVTATTTTGQQGLLPVGSDTSKPAQILFTVAPSTAGYLTATWVDGTSSSVINPALSEPAVTPSTIDRVLNAYWKVQNLGTLTGGTYTGTFTLNNASSVVSFANTTLLKRIDGGTVSDWTIQPTHVASSGSNTHPTVSRTGLTGFSEFAIGGGNTLVLPISIDYFRGSKVGGANFLDWKINCTSDPSVRIILERSADSRNFKSIQDQTATAARCAQGFNYTDASPLAGINYYRLKTISPDGAFKYSSVVALINKDKGFELISVAPNPVKTNTVLSISSVKAGRMSIAVSDMTGKVVMTKNINVIAGNNPITMNFATLGAGTYNIKVINADNEVKATRFVKY